MWTAATALALTLAPSVGLPTAVWPVAPEARASFDGQPIELRPTKDRAVLLLHGLLLHPIRQEKAGRPVMHDWQQPKADLVQTLRRDFDVYSFGYAQTVPVDAVSLADGLRTGVGRLKAAGYTDVVLIGHSAGGLIARQFVERFPDAGVSKVIQVGSPNTGSELARIGVGLPKPQVPFIKSLAPKSRLEAVPRLLPDGVEACCVVCKVARLSSDAMVGLESQWPADLQKQGVPAALVQVTHFDAMKAPHAVKTIAELAREPLARWTPEQVEQGRQVLFGKEADAAAVRKDGKDNGTRSTRMKPRG